jgi:hypothetical protein
MGRTYSSDMVRKSEKLMHGQNRRWLNNIKMGLWVLRLRIMSYGRL